MATKELIEWVDGTIIVGERIQTRGNDEDFPAFIISQDCAFLAGMHISVDKKRVLGPVKEENDDDLGGDTEHQVEESQTIRS